MPVTKLKCRKTIQYLGFKDINLFTKGKIYTRFVGNVVKNDLQFKSYLSSDLIKKYFSLVPAIEPKKRESKITFKSKKFRRKP